MTTFQEGTQTSSANSGSTSLVVQWDWNVAAGWIAILAAAVKDSAAVFTDPSGYVKIGEQTGGTGAAGDDVGTTKVAAWYRVLDGTEVFGSDVTIANDVGSSSAGAVAIYAPTAGHVFEAPIFVSGSDDVHDTDWSPSGFGTWPSAVGPGDVIVGLISSDTDAVTALDFGSLLQQTGIVFANGPFGVGLVNSSSTVGFDCSVLGRDWTVTSGSNTNAPSYSSQNLGAAACGAMMLVRIRETDTGGGVYTRQVIT